MDSRVILNYQELSSNAWPAKTIIFLHGWVLRLSEGVTKRANSVLPLKYNGQNVLKDIETVEKVYREKDLPVIFQLPDYFEPGNLQETLLSLGYESIDESLVMAAEIEDIKPAVNSEYTYLIEGTSSDHWFQALGNFSNRSHTFLRGQKNIIRRIPFSRAFCYAKQNNKIMGIGLGVIEREYLGIFDLAVHPRYRRKGIGQSMVGEMIQWARAHSVSHGYLQVQGDNSGAISLYKKIGFQECYRYRYFIG